MRWRYDFTDGRASLDDQPDPPPPTLVVLPVDGMVGESGSERYRLIGLDPDTRVATYRPSK